MPIADFRTELHAWLDEHRAELAPPYAAPGTLDEQIAQMQRVKAILFDAGWMRDGWPERVGGRGGSPMLRTELGAALAARGITDPGLFSLIEVLVPTLIDYAPPELAAEVVPRLLSGAEQWCQGFSEPSTGSDLSNLGCRATADGGHYVVNGQKVWTSLAQYSDRCVLLTRTGAPDSRHGGITAFLVDMDTPGITVVPIEMINGEHEFAEVFFENVVVPADRMLGELNGGWAVAMSILPFERSSCFWQRIAYLYNRLERLVEVLPPDDHRTDDRTAAAVGNAYLDLFAVRARSRATQHRLAGGATLGADTSIDKVLVATAEQSVYDTVRSLLPAGTLELGDDADSEEWRIEYLYSRAATIYGGTAEIQRNIIARRLLHLGSEG
jgi:alkylation response protein AidB-like acyl-CoA dehydrogenase